MLESTMVSVSGSDDPLVREYDWGTDSPCFAVIDAIARYEGVATSRMVDALPTLQHTLETDALDSLFRDNHRLTLSFHHAGYHVRIRDQTVAISRPRANGTRIPTDVPPTADNHSFT